MSSFLSIFGWGGAEAPAPQPEASAAASSPPSSDSDGFVLVDGDEETQATALATPPASAPSVLESVPEEPEAEPMPEPIKNTPMPSSSARACRLYGHAHNPPRLYGHARYPPAIIRASASSSAASRSQASSSTLNPKRSFAAIVVSHAPDARTPVAYAQPASVSTAEALLARLERLQSMASATEQLRVPPTEADLLDSIAYDKAPPRPTVPLSRAQRQLLYDDKTEWALSLDAPCSKRAKRCAASSAIIDALSARAEREAKVAKKRGKSKPKARIAEKELRRARGEKRSTMASASS